MAVTVLDCDVITPGPYSLNWGAPGIKDVYVYILIYIYMIIYWGVPGIKDVYIQIYIFIYLAELQKRADRADQSVLFFLAGANFYRFNAKNWQFTVYFAVIYAFFRCKFYSPKILLV